MPIASFSSIVLLLYLVVKMGIAIRANRGPLTLPRARSRNIFSRSEAADITVNDQVEVFTPLVVFFCFAFYTTGLVQKYSTVSKILFYCKSSESNRIHFPKENVSADGVA